jgi:hypothetical protein
MDKQEFVDSERDLFKMRCLLETYKKQCSVLSIVEVTELPCQTGKNKEAARHSGINKLYGSRRLNTDFVSWEDTEDTSLTKVTKILEQVTELHTF